MLELSGGRFVRPLGIEVNTRDGSSVTRGVARGSVTGSEAWCRIFRQFSCAALRTPPWPAYCWTLFNPRLAKMPLKFPSEAYAFELTLEGVMVCTHKVVEI